MAKYTYDEIGWGNIGETVNAVTLNEKTDEAERPSGGNPAPTDLRLRLRSLGLDPGR